MAVHRDRQSPARKLKGAPRAKRAKRCKRNGCDSHFVLNILYIRNEERFN